MSMEVSISDELLKLLDQSKLGGRPAEDRVRIALAIHLFQEGIISMGKAAEIAGEPRATFELLLADMGIPAVKYGLEDYLQDRETLKHIRRS